MMQGFYVPFLDNAILYYSSASMAARDLRHIIENEAI